MELWRSLGTVWLLEQWGTWARIPDDKLGFPSKSNFASYRSTSALPVIDVDLALTVDRAIKSSNSVNRDYETALVERYVKRKSQTKLAEKLRTNRREAVYILNRAEAWLDGYLYSLDDLTTQK
jgi:hypothetical protein